MSSSHPTFWKFLDVLKKQQNITRVKIFQTVGGHPPSVQRRRYLNCNSRILAIVGGYPNRGVIQYLRRAIVLGVSPNYRISPSLFIMVLKHLYVSSGATKVYFKSIETFCRFVHDFVTFMEFMSFLRHIVGFAEHFIMSNFLLVKFRKM